MGNNKQQEPQHMAQLLLLVTSSILGFALILVTLLMSWELWILPLIAGSVILGWYVHIQQKMDSKQRLWLYTLLIMAFFFFYGIHPTSTYDMTAVMTAIMIIYTIAGENKLVMVCELTYFAALTYGLVGMAYSDMAWDSLMVSRTLLHISLILFAGWLTQFMVEEWEKAFYNTDRQIEELNRSAKRMNYFLSNLSHELRTPVNVIMGTTEVMQDKENRPEAIKQLLSVRNAASQLTSHINDIMDYSELETKSLKVNNEPYMLSSLINDVIEELRPYVRHDIELIVNVDVAAPAGMISDVRKLRRIICNIAGNALKFTKEGGVYINVKSVRQDYGVNLCIEISDTGMGIGEDDLERVSKCFYQVENGKSVAVGGIGLGLPIAGGFVRALGGFVLLKSKINQGTSVRISIPQAVYDNQPCIYLKKNDLTIGGYLNISKFSSPKVREFYDDNIFSIVHGLGVTMHRVDNDEDLRKLMSKVNLTHLFVGLDEYLSSQEWLESLTTQIHILVVANDEYDLPSGSGAYLIKKPFSSFTIANLLNMDIKLRNGSDKSISCSSIHALVVDDEPMNLKVASSILQRYGMKVSTARSGPEAINMCKENEYDIVFMDHMMPVMDGVEAMQRIKAYNKAIKQNLPVVALTANALSGAKEMFITEGFDGFVSKPIEMPELERVLKSVLPETNLTSEKEGVASSGDIGLQPLLVAGIDISSGLRYCHKDEELYRTILHQFESDYSEKKKKLDECLKKNDLEGYLIIVHALKSTAKMIGADSLSAEAYKLEAAAKNRDMDYVIEHNDELLEHYEAVSGAISRTLPDNGYEGAGQAAMSETMEFYPEGGDEA